MRTACTAVCFLVMSGCGLVVGGQPVEGVEQFLFVPVVLGPDEFDLDGMRSLLQDVGDEAPVTLLSAHRIDTSLGPVEVADFDDGADLCRVMIGPASSSVRCGSNDPVPGGEITLPSASSGSGWAEIEVAAGPGVSAVVAVATDGTRYRARVVDGFTYIVYPEERGSLRITPVDVAGQATGNTLRTDEVFG